MNGKAVDLMCYTQAASLSEAELEECMDVMPKLLLFDSLSGWFLESYFAYVLFTYMNDPIEDDDDYEQA